VRGWRSSDGTPVTSLAISPLAGGDSATVYLSDGIHMAVTDLLRRLPQLTVIAPSLVRQRMAQEPGLDLQSLGGRLGVAAVLTWELHRTPDSLHLRTELLRTSDGRLLWGQTYDRPFTDLLALQSEIARTISDSLRLQLTGIDVANLARQQTSDVEAWDLYLQGRHLYYRASLLGGRRMREDTDSILRLAQRVLSRDPNFAGGHLLLSWYYSTLALRGLRRPFAALMDTSTAAARRATQLDSTFGDPWADLATPALWLTDDWATALENVRRAVRLNPNHAQAHQMLAVYFAEVEGNVDSGLIHARRAAALEPLPYLFNTLGDVYMRARRYDSAIAVLRPVFEADPGAPGPRGRLIRSYERLGRYAEAIAVRRRSPDSTDAVALEKELGREGVRGYRRALSGILQRKIDSLIRLRSAPPDPVRDTFPPLLEGRIAALYAQQGSWNRAMDWVLAEHQRRPKRFRLFLTNPDFDSLRLDPRFTALVRREGLESFLR
jgi:TolB-like protein